MNISTDIKSKIIADAKTFSENDFYVSTNAFDAHDVEKVFKTTFSRRGKLVDIIVGSPFAFESCNFSSDKILFKVRAGQLSFFPVVDDKSFKKFFHADAKHPEEDFSAGVVAVSHTLKWLNFFPAVFLDDGTICYSLYFHAYYPEMAWLPNSMHAGYRSMFNDRISIVGVHTCIEQYFAWKIYENTMLVRNHTAYAKSRIKEKQHKIHALENDIAGLQKTIDSENDFIGKFNLDINKARVEFDLKFSESV